MAVIIGWMVNIDDQGRLVRTKPIGWGDSGGDSPRRFGWPVRVVATVAAVLLVSASWVTAGRILGSESPRESYLVTPIQAGIQTPVDHEVADRLAYRLTRKLRGWDNLRAVASAALSGPRAQLGVGSFESPTLDQAFELADGFEAGTLLGLVADVRGDGVDVEVIAYDVVRRREIGQTWLLSGSAADLDDLIEPVAHDILELRDQVSSAEELRRESSNTVALQGFQSGLDALHQWRLDAAEQEFREVILQDSMFARAHHYLALTLFWQTSRNPHRIIQSGPEIARHTQIASRLAELGYLRRGFRSHINAFAAFWKGENEEARRLYREILNLDGSDTEAWLLLGAVEYNDRTSQERAGRFVPRGSWNAAREAFRTAADLSPDWPISFGQLFDIDRDLSDAARGLACPTFERPDAPARPRHEQATGEQLLVFCPLVADSVLWVAPRDLTPGLLRLSGEETERLLRESRQRLRSWSYIHAGQARPHDELATWLAWKRGTLGCMADGAEVRDLTAEILYEREYSLRLRADTTREDLVRLAMLRLATEDIQGATALVDRALADLPDGAIVPDEVANVFLARGMPERALEITEPTWSRETLSIDDPDGDGKLS
ncbi:MAG: hypothetical protein OEM96_05970, partial [Gemmatimonadota bacterium]|nr:hypothetical protein [Gemmatimonadota bacterium]